MLKASASWNLKLLYKSNADPLIEQDLRLIERACLAFEKEFKQQPFTSSPKLLVEALHEREKLTLALNGNKPWWYFALKNDLNSDDSASSALATKYEQRITEATNRIAFFDLEIAKITQKDQGRFLKDPILEPYRYQLSCIFKQANHNLSEGEEQLENLLVQTSYTMWIDAQERLLNQQVIRHKGKDVPIVEASAQLPELPKKERRTVHGKITQVLKSISHLAEAELNAIYNYKKVLDIRRGFAQPYSATMLDYQNDEDSIMTFVAYVTKRFDVAHRFYNIQAKLLGERRLTYADRGAKIGSITTKFDFQASTSILRSVLGRVDGEYVALLDSFINNGQLDVYPGKGKRGGAYCWGMGQLPTFLLLNHVDDVRSIETLAHEFGHAIHTELSKQQPPRYQHYSTATAEVASTFFEQLMSAEIAQRLSPKEQIILLHNKIQGDIQTIFRQIACFNFELELHRTIRKEGQVSSDVMASLMATHLRSYLGKSVEVTEDDGYTFVSWSHIRRFFYVYSYAYGQLISRALYQSWQQDPSYAVKIKQFLSAGRSMSPEAIFKSIGIDTSKTSFFAAGIQSIEKDIDRLEELSGTFAA
jgi:oligoendopeptidase F